MYLFLKKVNISLEIPSTKFQKTKIHFFPDFGICYLNMESLSLHRYKKNESQYQCKTASY